MRPFPGGGIFALRWGIWPAAVRGTEHIRNQTNMLLIETGEKAGRRLIPMILLATAGAIAAVPTQAADSIKLPPPATRTVDFTKDIQPIFADHCVKCHGTDKQKGGLRLDNKESALRGGDNHAPAIKLKESAESPLIQFVAGLVPDMKMPQKGDPLTFNNV